MTSELSKYLFMYYFTIIIDLFFTFNSLFQLEDFWNKEWISFTLTWVCDSSSSHEEVGRKGETYIEYQNITTIKLEV